MKRLFDFVGSLVFIVLGLPIFLVLWLWIKLDSKGPAVFRQPRAGFRGKPFTCLKFRSMVVDASDLRNDDGSTYNSVDDPRVTRAGRFLRKTSLDELPQLFNVLKGEMSLVGPRPDLVSQIELYDEEGREKFKVRPGLTGLAQISGRNSISLAKRTEIDVNYVRTRSIWGDLVILWRTVGYVLLRRGINCEAVSE